jgi:acyl carrier protein
MERSEISAAATEVFRRVFNLPDLELTDSLSAAHVPNWDSLTHVSLVVAIEERFQIRLTGKEIRNLQNVGELISLVERKCSKGNALRF